jgi:hypothetical protein
VGRVLVIVSAVVVACLGAASGCDDAYGEGATDPATTDASTDGAGPTDAGSASDESAPTCTPEPIEPFDAGTEDAHCGPNGVEVDLSSSPGNCGFCANSCVPNNCVSGACTASTTPLATGGDGQVFAHAVDPLVYFATSGSACNGPSRIRKIDLTGGSAAVDVHTESTNGCISWLDFDADRFFYLHTVKGLISAKSTDLADSSMYAVSKSIASIVLLPTSLVYVSPDNILTRIDRVTGAETTIYSGTQVTTLAANDGAAWWTDGPTIDSQALWTRASDGASSFKIADKVRAVFALAFDATHVFLASATGDVFRVPKAGGAAPELVTRIGGDNRFPRAMFVVGNSVFVAAAPDNMRSDGPIEVYRAKKCGGRARRIARDVMYTNSFTTTSTQFIYGAVSEVRSIAITNP